MQKRTSAFSFFNEVWQVRNNHYHKELPPQYIFLLTCCYSKDCPHPLCQKGPPTEDLKWFPNGPTLDHNLLPVVDPTQPFGDPNCSTCQDKCSGHFLPPEKLFESKQVPMIQPPSVILKDFFHSLSQLMKWCKVWPGRHFYL